MLHYILLHVVALALLACPSRPSRRPPVLPAEQTSTDVKRDLAGETTLQGAGYYLALRNDAQSGGYQPLVLRVTARGLATPVVARRAYSQGAVFSDTMDLAHKDSRAINLLLEFTVGAEQDQHCITTPLAEVVRWVSGDSETEIKQRLLQAKKQPLDLTASQGKLEQQAGGWQCVK